MLHFGNPIVQEHMDGSFLSSRVSWFGTGIGAIISKRIRVLIKNPVTN